MIKLIVKANLSEGEAKDYNYEFDQPVVTIGRLKENDIPLPVSTISGFHAQIVKDGDNHYLVDRGSINGTYLNGVRLVPGISVGVASGPEQGETLEILQRWADEALYRAKRAGKGRVSL